MKETQERIMYGNLETVVKDLSWYRGEVRSRENKFLLGLESWKSTQPLDPTCT